MHIRKLIEFFILKSIHYMKCNWYWWAFKTHVQTNNSKVLFIERSNKFKLKLNILEYLILNSKHFF